MLRGQRRSCDKGRAGRARGEAARGSFESDLEQGQFAGTSQQDIHEAFVSLTEAMNNVDVAQFHALQPEGYVPSVGLHAEALTTPFWTMFGGTQESVLKCSARASESRSREPFSCISVANPASATSVEALLQDFECEECMTEVTDVCTRCGAGGTLQKCTRVMRWTNVLRVHIRRLFVHRLRAGWSA